MQIRRVLPLAAGLAVAMGVTSLPASATDGSVTAGVSTWDKDSVSIGVGEKVMWTNPSSTGSFHNVCVAKPGDTPGGIDGSGCSEFNNGPPASDWTTEHVFTTAGTYKFICQQHPATMAGPVVVGGSGSTSTNGNGTGTSTTTPQDTMPTDTTTAPTQTQPSQSAPADTTAPAFAGKLKRRAS